MLWKIFYNLFYFLNPGTALALTQEYDLGESGESMDLTLVGMGHITPL